MRTLFIIMQGNIKVLAISSCEAKICNSLGDSSLQKDWALPRVDSKHEHFIQVLTFEFASQIARLVL